MTSDRNQRDPNANLPDPNQNNQKPMLEGQEHRHTYACRDAGNVECSYEFEAVDEDEVKDALMAHYIDAHPGHKADDAYALMMSATERYRG
jgi:hypothetical protein